VPEKGRRGEGVPEKGEGVESAAGAVNKKGVGRLDKLFFLLS
jgi:hypothetical protein